MNWGWLCYFLPHKWEPIINVSSEEKVDGKSRLQETVGLYQCKRCKIISKGTQLKQKERR